MWNATVHMMITAVHALQVVKPREDYVMVIDADSILRKPFIPEELHLKLGEQLSNL